MDGRLKLIVKRHDIKFDEWGIKKGMLCKQRETNGYDNDSNMQLCYFWDILTTKYKLCKYQ